MAAGTWLKPSELWARASDKDETDVVSASPMVSAPLFAPEACCCASFTALCASPRSWVELPTSACAVPARFAYDSSTSAAVRIWSADEDMVPESLAIRPAASASSATVPSESISPSATSEMVSANVVLTWAATLLDAWSVTRGATAFFFSFS